MNLSLYGTQGKWLMVDCGITFGDETTPGIEVIMPDIRFIAERKDDLLGIVLTHGHEDHLGAVEHLWPQLQCPIYATPFTAELLRSKLDWVDLKNRVRIIEIPNAGSFEIGPFRAEYIPVTHSIPEAHMLALKTNVGTVLHTGDWKLDPEPLMGHLTDEARLQALGREGVMALIGDSTNAPRPGHSGSEREVQDGLKELFGTIKERVVVTCFASNIARLKAIAAAAKKHGRYVTLVGRSLWRNAEIAESCGYLPEFNQFLSENEAMLSPRDKIVFVCTGCQGEPRAALPRIAANDHPEVELDAGDTVIFSSFDIPGNEKAIGRLQNRLIEMGLRIVTRKEAPIHVSGHPAQEEITKLYQWVRPHLSVPVHGERRHQTDHATLAAANDTPHTIIPSNGKIIRLGPGIHEEVAEVHHGRLGLDGKILRKLDHAANKERKKLTHNGAVMITLVVDDRGMVVNDPMVAFMGIVDDESEDNFRDELGDLVAEAVERMPKSTRNDDVAVRHTVMQTARRFMQDSHGKKPLIEAHVVRV